MNARKFWGSISQRTTALFLVTALLSVLVLIWMGLRLIQQDRVLEVRQLEEKREAAADRIVAALERLLEKEESRLSDPQTVNLSSAEGDFVLVLLDSQGIGVWPENALLYYPFVPAGPEASPRLFVPAERAEFQQNNYERAITFLRTLVESNNPPTQAAARLRLARNLRKAGRLNDALVTYQELANHTALSPLSISGVPYELVARSARCALLAKMEYVDQLQLEAKNLFDDLKNRRWRLERTTYLYYLDQARDWLNLVSEPELELQALAESVIWIWNNSRVSTNMNQSEAGRSSLHLHDRSITVLWQRSGDGLAAVVAGPHYQHSQWFDPLFSSSDFSSIRVCLHDSEGILVYGNEPPSENPFTSRSALASRLPWDVTVANAHLESDLSQFAQRRRLMMMGLGILVLLVIAVSYLISRAVSRELAAARLQANFVSAVSHEFRTPLTSMRQFTDMLNEDDSLSDEKRRLYYNAQARATSRLSRLVESLLDFGRMEAGAHPYRFEKTDAGQLVKNVVVEYLLETGSPGSRIEYVVPDKGPVVDGDRDALEQALWNLIDNAVKYSAEGQKVYVEVEAGKQVAIKVRDQGFGILPAEKSRILRKFVRGSNAKEHNIKGTGIGLAVVKHIIDAHGGDMLIDSEPGKGSTFTVLLPAGG